MIKLYIRENNEFLSEDIAAVKKYYPNIDDDTFDMLIKLDPTYRGNQSLGKYGKWILNLFNKNKLSNEDMDNITDVLNQFTTYRNRIANKDLNSYKSVADLEDTLATVVDDDSMLTDRQKVRFLKNVKSGKVKTSADDDYDVVLDTPNFIVYVPNTHEASMKLGKGTKWCTAHENPDWFNKYTKNNGKLYIIKNKKTGERWQYSDLKGDFLDENDKDFNISELMKQDEKLSKFFKKFLGVDYYNFDGILVYDGSDIPDKLKSQITKIIIDENVTEIGDFAFEDCDNLTSINISNSVTEIGRSAFQGCSSLISVKISDSVTIIGKYAFNGCESLTSINIPNSVTEIGRGVFRDCTNLTSINIPNSVTEIEDFVFRGCTNLTSVKIPNGVTIIGDYAFTDCESLTTINIPNSVTTIGRSAFIGCESLTSINIPNSVTELGDFAFSEYTNLTIYTNNKYMIDYCDENDILVKPLNANESYRNNYRKLHLR